MTKMLLILTYAIGIYALLVLFLFLFQRSYLYFPSKEKIDVSYFIDSGLKEIELTTKVAKFPNIKYFICEVSKINLIY